VCLFAACADDNDSNPTLTIPATFQLNTPAFAKANTVLANSTELPFTWSQPDYGGFPVAAQYQMEFSINQSFTTSVAQAEADETGATIPDYVALDQIYNGCSGSVNPSLLARGLQQIARWPDAASVPATLTIYARLVADYANQLVYSNIVPINVAPYYVELKNAPIETWWLIGADIADGSWGGDMGKCIIPMQPIEGEEYDKKTGQGKIRWIGYLAGNGFKLKEYPDSWDYQWGQGDSFGTFVKNDGGSSDIKVPEAGLYAVILDTGKDNLEVVSYDGPSKVFEGMAISGSFNDWGDTEMTPCSTDWENHDWYVTQHLDAGVEIKIKQAGSWDFNKGGELVPDGDDLYAFGVDGGANFKITEAADYLIIFNDITGFVRFIKK
jgi:hypothetical protein